LCVLVWLRLHEAHGFMMQRILHTETRYM
jgi:hypothetical protein